MPRCVRCRLHEVQCLCAAIPRIETRTRVVLVIHRYENRKSTNTGRLAVECLANSEILIRGHRQRPDPHFVAPAGTLPLLLFPDEGARPLADFAGSTRPVALIVPDGTWRQASKVRNRVPGLRDLPMVGLPHDAPSAYRLRTETREEGLATMEAIARALGILEGAVVRKQLEDVFGLFIQRSLAARGIGNPPVTIGSRP